MKKNVSIIMPVFNEEKTVASVVEVIESLAFVQELIIVDDASSDGTPDILDRLKGENIKVLTHSQNQGKTAAIVTALENVTGDITAIQDADLEYDPRELEFCAIPSGRGRPMLCTAAGF